MKSERKRTNYCKIKIYQCINTLIYLGLIFLFFPISVNAQVSINEYLPDSSTQEWIEFYNSSPSAEYIKNYYLDDDTDFLSDSGSSAKKALTALNISNPQFPYFETSSFLNNSGDYVVLFDQSGNIIDQHQFNSNPGQNITFGRYPDGTGSYFILSYSTKADANSSPPTPSPTPTQTATSQPTQTPTPTQTAIPTAKPTPSINPTPIKTLTPKPSATAIVEQENRPTSEPEKSDSSLSLVSVFETSTPQPEVLGDKTISDMTTNKSSVVAILFIFLGLLFLGYGGFLIYNKYKLNNEQQQNSNPS